LISPTKTRQLRGGQVIQLPSGFLESLTAILSAEAATSTHSPWFMLRRAFRQFSWLSSGCADDMMRSLPIDSEIRQPSWSGMNYQLSR
jgi:hypothetical protein